MAVATCDLDALIISGESPFPPPFPIGHECVAEVVDVGDAVRRLTGPARERSLSDLLRHVRAVPARAHRQLREVGFMSSYGFGPAVERWGGFLSDLVCVPYAEHMLVPLPAGLDPASVASASDNIGDAWRTVAPGLAEDPARRCSWSAARARARSGCMRGPRGGAGLGVGHLRRRRPGPS